jgi:uncharacterized membrane protein SpoIIM required for sporulation
VTARAPRGRERPELELRRFEALVERCEALRTRGLPFDELRELGRLYRAHSGMLSRLRDRDADPDAIRHLNGLCVRAYAFLYARGGPPKTRRRYALAGSSQLDGALRAFGLAWALLAVGSLVGGSLAVRDPAALYALLPIGFGYTAERIDRLWSSEEARAEFLARDETPAGQNLLFGSQLFAHNTRVGVLSFATGMLAGIPTVLLQVYNGMMLGAFAGLFFRDALPVTFLAWLLPHAVPELTAITLCGAAGLMLGAAVAAPGRRRRRTAIAEASLPSLFLVATSVPLFLLAALTESFVRESALGTAPRLAIAAAYTVLLVGSVVYVARLSRRRRVDTSWLADVSEAGRTGDQASA